MNCLRQFSTPQLELLHRGKVRDSYRIDDETRLIAVSDRLSAFDSVLESAIPCKGAVLNGIANFWFEKTKDLIDSHFIDMIDPNVTLVKEAIPQKIEVIVRAYLTGSMWRGYQKGQRTFSGVTVPDGLTKHQKFSSPIVTPTTKEKSDRPITPQAIVEEGWVEKEIYEQMAAKSLELFDLGSKYLAEKGIILVDTKYEFGLINGKLVLIDEIHTPDSSRFWRVSDYAQNPENVEQIDKEFVRQWLIANKKEGKYPTVLPKEIIVETTKRYKEIYTLITGNQLNISENEVIKSRISHNLAQSGVIKDAYVLIVMGSKSDLPHCQKIQNYLRPYHIHTELRVLSAHKNGEEIVKMAEILNNSFDSGVVIAVAGRSNGLGGALAANLNVPVISCPPFRDKVDMLTNINSSLMMPSKTPALTMIQPDNAAYAALRCLNLPRLRSLLSLDIQALKRGLKEADLAIRQNSITEEILA